AARPAGAGGWGAPHAERTTTPRTTRRGGSRLRPARRRGRSRPPGASGLCAGLRLRDALARRVHDPPPLGHRADELHALAEEPLRLLPAGRHLLDRLPDVTRREVVAPVEGLDRLEDLVGGDLRVRDRALLVAGLVDQAVDGQVVVLGDEVVEGGARVGRGERDLERLGLHLAREAHGLLDGVAGLAREAQDEGPVDQDAELVAVPGEATGALDAHPLADVLQDLLVPRLVADDEEAEPAILQDFQGLAVDVGARVGRPGDTHPAEALRDLARARRIGGEGVVVGEELLYFREGPALRDRHHGQVELLAGDEVDDRRVAQRLLRHGGDVTAHEADRDLGFTSLIACAVRTSARKEGVLVCTTSKSKSRAMRTVSSGETSCGGASRTRAPGSMPAG